MSQLLFQLRAVNSEVESDLLNLFLFSEETQTADMTIFREIDISTFGGIQLQVNTDQFDFQNPESNDINLTFTSEFFEGPLKNLFNGTFEFVTGTTSINTTLFDNADYIQTILSDANFTIEYWQELAVSALIDRIFGNYKRTPLISNEDTVVNALSNSFNSALNSKLSEGNGKVKNDSNFIVFGIGQLNDNDFFDSAIKMLKKALVSQPSRLESALNNAGNFVDFNSSVFQIGDLIEIIMILNVNDSQNKIDGSPYSGSGVVVRVILKLVASPPTPTPT